MYLITSGVLALVLVHLAVFVSRVDHRVGLIVHVVLLHVILAPSARGAMALALSVVSSRLATHGGMGLLSGCLGYATGILARVAVFVTF